MAVITAIDTNNGNSKLGDSISITTLTNVLGIGQNIVADDAEGFGVVNDGCVLAGNNLESHGSRIVLVSPRGKNTGVSNTGIGYAVYFEPCLITGNEQVDHAFAGGRGILHPFANAVIIGGSTTDMDVYFGMGWTHRYAEPGSGLTEPNITKYNSTLSSSNNSRVIIHGPDAYDDWGARGEDDIQDNVRGGDLIMMAGRPTNAGEPGVFKVQGGDRVAAGENTKQAVTDYLICDYSTTADHLGLQVIDNTGTIRRIKYYDDGAGKKVLYF